MSDERQAKPKRPAPAPAMPPKPAETAIHPAGPATPAAAAQEPVKPAETVMAAAETVMAAKEAAAALPEPAPKPALALPRPAAEPERVAERGFVAYRAAWMSMSESHSAIASDVTEMALEMTEMAHANLKAAGDGLTAFLKARSLVDAVEAQLGFARRSLDAMVGGSTRLGELGLRLAGDATKPILRPFAG
jgi:hypothetical protein